MPEANVVQLASRLSIGVKDEPGPVVDTGTSAGEIQTGDLTIKELRRTSTIVIVRGSNSGVPLRRSENCLLRLLEGVAKRLESNTFDLEQMKHICEQWTSGYKLLDNYNDAREKEFDKLKASANIGGMTHTISFIAILYDWLLAFTTSVIRRSRSCWERPAFFWASWRSA